MRIRLGVTCLLFGVGVGLGRESVVWIEPEYAGVIYRPFANGTDVNKVMDSGLHFIAPWNEGFSYDLREQIMAREVTGLSREGKVSSVNATVRFRLQQSGIGKLHQQVGPDYVEKVVWPEVAAHCRILLGKIEQNEFDALPDEMRKKIERDITDSLGRMSIVIEAVRLGEFTPAE